MEALRKKHAKGIKMPGHAWQADTFRTVTHPTHETECLQVQPPMDNEQMIVARLRLNQEAYSLKQCPRLPGHRRVLHGAKYQHVNIMPFNWTHGSAIPVRCEVPMETRLRE